MPFQPGFRGRKPLVLSLFGSSTANNAVLALPASIIAGDLILYGNWARNFSGGASPNTPAGYTTILDRDDLVNGTSSRCNVWYKIAAGTEGGGNPGGTNGGVENQRWALVFRGDSPIVSVNVGSTNYGQSDGDPASQNCTASGGVPPLVVVAGYRSSGNVTTRSFSPAEDTVISPSGISYVKDKIYNAAPADVSVDMGDDGNSNTLWSTFIACAKA